MWTGQELQDPRVTTSKVKGGQLWRGHAVVRLRNKVLPLFPHSLSPGWDFAYPGAQRVGLEPEGESSMLLSQTHNERECHFLRISSLLLSVKSGFIGSQSHTMALKSNWCVYQTVRQFFQLILFKTVLLNIRYTLHSFGYV